MRLIEPTKNQMKANGIDAGMLSESTIVLVDNYGNMHLFDVNEEAVRPEKTAPHEFDFHAEESKMKDYFGDKGDVLVVDGRIAETFRKNHGEKARKTRESMALVMAELQDNSDMAFRLGQAFRSDGAEVVVYRPFFYKAYRLIMEGD